VSLPGVVERPAGASPENATAEPARAQATAAFVAPDAILALLNSAAKRERLVQYLVRGSLHEPFIFDLSVFFPSFFPF
jgi:hypothetical protein